MSNYQAKPGFNYQYQMTCSMDMDSFEITKAESIKKYEENVYLLGTIFNMNTPNTEIPSAIEEDSEGEDEINSIFIDKENNEGDDDMDQDERIERLIGEINTKSKNGKIQNTELVSQLNEAYKQLKNEENFINNKKKIFKDNMKTYENIISTLKNTKNAEKEEYFNTILEKANNLGVVSDTYKQIEKKDEEKNKELPFDANSNLLIIPL